MPKRARQPVRRPRSRAATGPEKINAKLAPLVVPIDSLTPDPENAREHGERNLDSVRYSLETFGQQKPVVCTRSGVVAAGNGLLAAATSLGWKRLAAIPFDSDDVELVRAFALADNRTAELSEWSLATLSLNLTALGSRFDMARLGWADFELGPLVTGSFTPATLDASTGTENGPGRGAGEDDDEAPEGRTVFLTLDQWEMVARAIAKVRKGAADVGEGRALELIAADFLAGA